ncbi:hypothetical protein FCN80_21000 [Martelella alba]|uniref:Uncharacterized protein n=2 Tax=Martelella alba TaxID=2590451 RepID=A0ABY2SFC3_9HYPH|nr:hypothetical protein FCN80_21000 [Martelella alba]
MIVIHRGFGLSIKRGHMFGDKESQRKMLSIKLPFLSIYILNGKSSDYFYQVARFAFNDPDWFIENHAAVRQAKRAAQKNKDIAWIKAREEAQADYQKQLDELREENYQLKQRCRENSRDIEAYKKLMQR